MEPTGSPKSIWVNVNKMACGLVQPLGGRLKHEKENISAKNHSS